MISDLIRVTDEELVAHEKYQVQFGDWFGPYDLILQVIDDQELNLLDLDISVLLDHYILYLDALTSIDLEEAGEFLVVAATLAQIKSKLLLPKDEQSEEVSEIDPREDLVRYLMEYQKIKQAAELLKDRPLLGRDVFTKGHFEAFEGFEADGRGTLFQLVKGFQKAIREFKSEAPFQVTREEVSVAVRMREVFDQLKDEGEVRFERLIEAASTKSFLIATFLSVLELVRLKKVKLMSRDQLLFLKRTVDSDSLETVSIEELQSEFDAEPLAAEQ